MNPPVLLWITIGPKSEADQEKLAQGLTALTSEDPLLRVRTDPKTPEVILGAVSELQLETIVDRLRREYGVEADVGRPVVVYKERLTKASDGEMKYAGHAGGRGHYGHVKIHLVPGEPGTGYIFKNDIVRGTIPEEFIKSIDEGIGHALGCGVLHGFPVDDVRIELYDGSYHDVDSSDVAFRIAAALAFEDAARKAQPVLVEPVMRVRVAVLEEHLDDVADNLVARRGQIVDQEGRAGMQVLTALVPLVDMFGYASDLRQRTLGRGTFEMEFAHYRPCGPSEEDGDRDAHVRAPRTRPPTLKDSRIALPEPKDDAPDSPYRG
jgi:elongation factor G